MRFADGASTDLTVAAVYELRDTVGDLMITSDDRSWLAWSPPCGRPAGVPGSTSSSPSPPNELGDRVLG
ncbi:MAG: hypothetical protein M3337_04700 [Actinomycetota bacterium]|nr:hypothetical protein [Actinomycetota bacterium]